MSPITVVHQIDPREFRLGGVEGVLRDIIRFAPSQVTFDIVGVDARGDIPLGRWTSVDIGGRACRFLPVARLDASSPSRIPHTAQLVAGLARFRSRIAPRELHAHRSELGSACDRLFHPRRLVQFIHGDSHAGTGSASDSLWRFAPAVFRMTERSAARRAEVVVVFSRSGASRLSQRFEGVHYSPAWFDPGVFRLTEVGRRPRTVIFAGRLEAPKDPLLFIDVVAVLRDGPWPDVRATVVGDGSLGGAVRDKIGELGLGGAVRMLGPKSPTELAERLASHAVCVVPSHFEGPTPRIVVESLATGTPVVATADADPDRLLAGQTNGQRSPGRSPDELARMVVNVAGTAPRRVADSVGGQSADRLVARIFDAINGAVPR